MTIPAVATLFVLGLITIPITLPLAAIVDVVRWLLTRTPFMATRVLAFGMAYLSLELMGLIALASVWVAAGFGASRRRLLAGTYAVQARWAEAVLDAVRRVFGLDVSAHGLDRVVEGPILLLARHTSIVDNLLPAHFVSRTRGIRLAYVMKTELLLDPCLDVAGNRLPNLFVNRGSSVTEGEIAALRRLGASIGAGEGVLIYPEGTRFDPAKLAGAVQRLKNRSPELHEIASGFRSVLPPRPAGTLALLESHAGDVVVMAHRGLDGFARVVDIWKGAMVNQTVEVEFWRLPRTGIPAERALRVEWLYRLWSDVDAWVVDGVRPAAQA